MQNIQRQALKLGLLFVLGLLSLAACGNNNSRSSVIESLGERATLAPGESIAHRDAPIAVNAGFHNDDARVVGNTGRPQFVEFYTEW